MSLLIDGSVRSIKARRLLPIFRALPTRAGVEVVSSDAYRRHSQ
jgi:hypothetical protein